MVTMLDMHIAIRGDTFEGITESRELTSIKTKLNIVSEYSHNIPVDDEDEKNFLFVVTPDDDGEDDGVTWEGTVRQLTRFTERRVSKMEASVNKQLQEIKSQADREEKEVKELIRT